MVQKTCPSCSTSTDTDKSFCQTCGTPYNRNIAPPRPTEGGANYPSSPPPPPPPPPPFQGNTGQASHAPFPYGSPYPGPPVSNGKATASLVLGVVGLLCFGLILGIIALVLAGQAKTEINRSPGRYSNAGAATAGQVLGIIDVVFGFFFILWWF